MTKRHIATLLTPAWGQTTSYIHVATQMLNKDPDVVITIVQHNVMVAQMETELASDGRTYDKARLRTIGVGPKKFVLSCFIWVGNSLPFDSLVWRSDIKRGPTNSPPGGWILSANPPRKALKDGPRHTRRAHQASPWFRLQDPSVWSTGAVSLPAYLSEPDVLAIAEEIYADEAKRGGRSLNDILQQVVMASNGTDKLSGAVVKFPGGLEMYDHECHPYAAGPALLMGAAVADAQKLAKSVDGFIATTSSCIEPTGVPYCRELYEKRGQELFTIGMQAHPCCWDTDVRVTPSDERVRSFLDSAVSPHGKRSVVYISFGSIYFPVATRQHVETLVTTLLDLKKPFPFIFALGSKVASLPQDLIERVNASGKGLICNFWVEQRAILQHGAVGWFLTHGGWNSLSESLTQGIPLIIWPASGEQTLNAAFFSTGPNAVAIELLQIRTGAQIGPSLYSDAEITGTLEDASEEFKETFAAARGAMGEILRGNAAKMASDLKIAQTGEASEEIVRLANV
ncbi:hypothetical protein FB451DRAFT_1450543 [Mycena latifolia]|nr:hypothetical protein FB451DRAFT_1450543 [Mycena latifolia]